MWSAIASEIFGVRTKGIHPSGRSQESGNDYGPIEIMVKRPLSAPSKSLLFFQLTCLVNLFYQTQIQDRDRPGLSLAAETPGALMQRRNATACLFETPLFENGKDERCG
jgi:hypothetical protein